VSTSKYLSETDKSKLTTPISSVNLPEPTVITQAGCSQEEIVLSSGATFKKSNFSTMVVVFDIICTIILVLFVRWLEYKQKEYAEEYAD
jgi:hypothetical protein